MLDSSVPTNTIHSTSNHKKHPEISGFIVEDPHPTG